MNLKNQPVKPVSRVFTVKTLQVRLKVPVGLTAGTSVEAPSVLVSEQHERKNLQTGKQEPVPAAQTQNELRFYLNGSFCCE